MLTEPRPLPIIRDEAVALIRRVHRPAASDNLAHLRRQAARALVEARQHFVTAEGLPDWSGRTGAYHDFAADVYAAAGVPRAEAATLQASMRYHVGNIVRETLAAEDQRAAGLASPASPRERAAARRVRRSATIDLLASGAPLAGPDIPRALSVVGVTLARLSPEALAALPAEDAEEARRALRHLAATAGRLARA